MYVQKGEHTLRDIAAERHLIVRKCNAAADEPCRTRDGVRIEDLTFADLGVVAGIEDRIANMVHKARSEQRRKVASAFSVGGQGGDIGSADIVAVLLIVEKEESFVMAVVDLGNPNGPAQISAEVVLMVPWSGRAIQIINPGICIEFVIVQDVERGPMPLVASGLSCEALHTAGGPSKFGGKQ